jgi:hypothetical protein
MAINNTRRQNQKSSIGRNTNENRASGTRLLRQLATGLFGAMEDHRKWIDSDRARTLGTTFEVTGRLLTYGTYLALAYLGIASFLDIRSGIATGIYAMPGDIGGSRLALFNILATGLVGPIAIIGIGIAVGWVYNLTVASANRLLPRFARPLVHPSVMFVVVAAFAVYQSVVESKVAAGYLYAQANIEAASPQASSQEAVLIKVIEIPDPDLQSASEIMGHDSSGEREMVRLQSMFKRARPCSKEGQGTELNPESEFARPEPGLAPGRDCQVGKKDPHE